MELVKGNDEKVSVFLGGIIYQGCLDDTFCPGNSHCALNATWAEFPSMCTCSALYGFQGANCTERGPQTEFVFALSGLTLIVAVATILLSLISLYRVYTRLKPRADIGRRRKHRKQTVILSMLSILISAGLCIVSMALQIDSVNRFPKEAEIVLGAENRLEKTLPGQDTIIILYVCTHIATMCTVLMLALSFIHIVKRSETLSTTQRSRVRSFVVLYLLVSVAIFIPMATQPVTWQVMNTILFVVTFLVGITYFFGALKLRRLIKESNLQQNRGLRQAGKRLYITSFTVGTVCVLVTFLGAYSGLGVPRSHVYTPPEYPLPREVCFRVSVLLLAVAQLLVARYLLPTKSSSTSSRSDSNAEKHLLQQNQVVAADEQNAEVLDAQGAFDVKSSSTSESKPGDLNGSGLILTSPTPADADE